MAAHSLGWWLSSARAASSVPVGPHGWLRVAARALRSVIVKGLKLRGGEAGQSRTGQKGVRRQERAGCRKEWERW